MDEEFWNKKFVIYLITNLLTGKKYVGQTRQKLKKRISQHKNSNKSDIDRDIRQYGFENFKIEVLEECSSTKELNEREKYWIRELNTIYPNGYNKSAGGGNYNGLGRAVRCIDTGEIFESAAEAERALGIRAQSISRVCLKQRIRAGGLKFEYIDDPLTEEEKFRERKKARIKKVRCLEYPDMIFESVTAAGKYFGIDTRFVSKACRGELIATKGLCFEFIDEKEHAAAEIRRKKISRPEKSVRCIENNTIYFSAKEASDITKIDSSSILKVCHGKAITAGGLHWEFTDEKQRVAPKTERKKTTARNRPVICIDTGKIYESIQAASREMKINRGCISFACSKRIKTAGGYRWEYANTKED